MVVLGWWVFLMSEVPLYRFGARRGRSGARACTNTSQAGALTPYRGTSLIRNHPPVGPVHTYLAGTDALHPKP